MNNQKSTFITLFATLQPAIQRNLPLKVKTLRYGMNRSCYKCSYNVVTFAKQEECATGETDDMRAHVTGWKQAIVKKFGDRAIKPFVMNIEGDTILCIRYLKPIKPPDSLCSEGKFSFEITR